MASAAAAGQSEMTATVVVVDDQADLRFLVEKTLTSSGFQVVGTAGDGEAGVELVIASQPDIVVLDLAMPRLGGEAALPMIVRDAPSTMIAILSAHLGTDRAQQLLMHGAFAAYEKNDVGRLPDLLTEDLHRFWRVMEGEEAIPSWQHRYRRT